jgi:hypothetical protein
MKSILIITAVAMLTWSQATACTETAARKAVELLNKTFPNSNFQIQDDRSSQRYLEIKDLNSSRQSTLVAKPYVGIKSYAVIEFANEELSLKFLTKYSNGPECTIIESDLEWLGDHS